MIIKYIFNDGTTIILLDRILSTEKIRALQELHGKYRVESEDKEGMIFEVDKTYQHSTGKRMTIIGRLKTRTYGECLIGECDTGELIPVGESKDNTAYWHEQVKDNKE